MIPFKASFSTLVPAFNVQFRLDALAPRDRVDLFNALCVEFGIVEALQRAECAEAIEVIDECVQTTLAAQQEENTQ